jgi:hypothetical protein
MGSLTSPFTSPFKSPFRSPFSCGSLAGAIPPCFKSIVSWHTGDLLDSTHRRDVSGHGHHLLITPGVDPITNEWDGADATYSYSVIGTPAPAAIVAMDAVQQNFTDGAGNSIGFTQDDLEAIANDQYMFGSVAPKLKEFWCYDTVQTGLCLEMALIRAGAGEWLVDDETGEYVYDDETGEKILARI